MRKATKTTTIHLRLPPDLKQRLDAAAASSGRSLNSEIARRILASFEPEHPKRNLVEIADTLRVLLEEGGVLKKRKRGPK